MNLHLEEVQFLAVYVEDIKMTGKKQNMKSPWKEVKRKVDLDETISLRDQVYLG